MRQTTHPAVLAVAVALAVVTVLACAVGGVEDGSAPAGPEPTGSGERRRAEQPTVEEFNDDIRGAVQVAEAYWRDRFNESGRRFAPVRQIVPYTQEGEVSCGGEPVPRNNAVYCPAGDFIAYDVNFAVTAFARVGDAFLYYLLGHEYAHAIQVRLGVRYEYTISQELQADCMAGAYIGDSIKADRLTIEDGDIEEFRDGLLAVGDDPSVPWFAPGAHGSAQQRTDAFFNGYEKSLDPCGITG